MNYFKFLYERYKKRNLIYKLIEDYKDFEEEVLYAEMNSVDILEFQDEVLLDSHLDQGVCSLAYWKYDKYIGDTEWVRRHIKYDVTSPKYAMFWCLPLFACSNYEELHENIQKRINILYTELNNPKI